MDDEVTSDGRRRYRSPVFDNERWTGFEHRADDIVISTPPKCGTTWMQMLCALLVFHDPELPGRLTELSPWVDIQTESIDEVRATLAAQEHRRFIKTHTPFDGMLQDERVTYICVGRDPRDAALSWDAHRENMNLEALFGARAATVGLDDLAELLADGPPAPPPDDQRERFWAWIEDDPAGIRPSGLRQLLHHLETFWVARDEPNVALFHYRDLQGDLDGEMRRLADILGIAIDEARWPTLVAAATFANMRDRADQLAPQVKVEGFWRDPRGFFHEGSSDKWRSLLTDDDVGRYEASVRALASYDLVDWAHRGWRGATV